MTINSSKRRYELLETLREAREGGLDAGVIALLSKGYNQQLVATMTGEEQNEVADIAAWANAEMRRPKRSASDGINLSHPWGKRVTEGYNILARIHRQPAINLPG